MHPSKLTHTNRLRTLREDLSTKKVDLQRVYNFSLVSLKLRVFRDIAIRITAASHPYINFENAGDWRGYVNAATKPAEMSITFLEDDSHIVNGALELWDQLKYNKSTGIHYPKAVYEDQGMLIYHGPNQEDKSVKAGRTQYSVKTRSYILTGFYPIKREDSSLDYDTNDVLKLGVPFNVDDIRPLHVLGVGT